MPTAPWNRKPILCISLLQGALALIILALSATSIPLLRSEAQAWDREPNHFFVGPDYSIFADDQPTGPILYAYNLAVVCVASATFLTFLVSIVLILTQKANFVGTVVPNVVWAICWLGLFAYGIYYWTSLRIIDACPEDIQSNCAENYIEFAFFILTPFEFFLTLFFVAIAVNAHRRKSRGRAGVAHSTATTAVPFYPASKVSSQPPYPQYQQGPPPMRELHAQSNPTSELHSQSRAGELYQQRRPMNELPVGAAQPDQQ